MRALSRYVVIQVLEVTGIVALGLVAMYTLVVFVSDINEAGKGDYGVLDVLAYSALQIPGSLYILMPIIALLGTLMGVGGLARSSELTAMRAAGISLAGVGGWLLAAGAVLGAFAFALGDWVAPYAEHRAESLRDIAHGGSGAPSIWLRNADRIIRIRELLDENHVRGVTVFHTAPDGHLTQLDAVREGRFDGAHWQLEDVRRTRFDGAHVETAAFARTELEGGIPPNVLKLFVLESNSLSVAGLVHLIGYLNANHLDAAKYRLAMWRKLVEPLTVVVMMVFAVPFASGRMREANAGQRLLAGMLIGIVFYVVNKVSVSLGDIYGWPAPLAASTPTLALAAVAAWRLRSAN